MRVPRHLRSLDQLAEGLVERAERFGVAAEAVCAALDHVYFAARSSSVDDDLIQIASIGILKALNSFQRFGAFRAAYSRGLASGPGA